MVRSNVLGRCRHFLGLFALLSVTFAEPYVYPDSWTDLPAAEAQYGGVLRYPMLDFPRTYNPLVSVERNFVVAVNTDAVLGAATLGWHRPDDQTLEPRAAKSWQVSADGLTIDVQLRSSLMWSDGMPITAADYLISYELQVDHAAGPRGPEAWLINGQLISVEATGTHALRVRLPAPDRLSLNFVAGLYPLPDHVFGAAYRTGGAQAVTALWGTDTPPSQLVFSGFLRLVDAQPDERLTFERNPHFGNWNLDAAGRPLPYLDGLQFTFLEADATLNMFLAGQLDFIRPRDLDDLGTINAAVTNRQLDAVVDESAFPIESSFFLAFNWNLASDPDKQSLFRDRRFRRAVSHLIDRRALIDLVHSGAGHALHGPVHPAVTTWFHESALHAGFNPQLGARLLQEVGFTQRDSAGYLTDGQGRRASFVLTFTAGNPLAERPAQVIADVLREAGIEVRLDPATFPSLVERVFTDGQDRPFEAVILGFTPPDPAWPFPEMLYSCGGALRIYNRSGNCLASAELLMADLALRGRTTVDNNEAWQLARELQDLDADLSAKVYLTVPMAHIVSSGRVRGRLPRQLWGPANGDAVLFVISVQ